jgi:tyrosine-protein kinase Etk/Wzc
MTDTSPNRQTAPQDSLNSTHLLYFIYSRWKLFAVLGLAAGLISSGVALLLEEQFRSTVVLFATPQHSIGEQFFEEVKQNDLLEYGETEDAERLLQILNSDRIRTRIIEKYNLWQHYEIDRSEPGAQTLLAKQYASNVDAGLTRYGSIEVSVLDKNPQQAADMANDIAYLADSVANELRNGRAMEAFQYARGSYTQVQEEIAEMERQLGELYAMGIYDFGTQIEGLNEQYATAIGMGKTANAEKIRQQMENLSRSANQFNKLTNLLDAAYEREAILKKRYELMKLDAETKMPSAFVVDRAVAADKKAKPIRWLIVVISTGATLAFALLALLAAENIRKASAE